MTREVGMKKSVIKVGLFLVLLLVALGIAQEVLQAKFINDSTSIVNGFLAEEEQDIDVLFIGSSNCFTTINPLVLYEKYGIASYNLASSSQTMEISLLYLKEALKRQTPKVVALEVNYIPGQNTYGVGESSMRWGLTDIPFSIDKLKCIYQLHGKIDGEFMSYVFPILRYHERWKEISQQDYVYMTEDKKNWSKGYLYTNEVSSELVDLSDYEMEGGAWLDEDAVACLDEMIQICQEQEIELLLFKSPREEWYQYMSAEIQLLATQSEIPFIDYHTLLDELGIDVATDFRDGSHLNNYGAQKVSEHMGAFLKSNYELPDRRTDQQGNSWDEALEYLSRKEGRAIDLSKATNVKECKEIMDGQKDYATLLTYYGGEELIQYQGLYIQGEEVFSKVWETDGIEHRTIEDTEMVIVRNDGNMQVYIENENYYQPQKKWNVIVYDLKQEKVVAILDFDE